MAGHRSDKCFYALPTVGREVAKQTTATAVADGACGRAGGRVEVSGCLGEVAQVPGNARVRREAVAEPLRRPERRQERLIDGGLEPVELEEDHLLGGIVAER